MNKVAQRPILAFAVALAAVGLLSVMDAVMKGLVLAIGVYVTSVWRALIGAVLAACLYLPRRTHWPDKATLRIHLSRAALITVMGLLFFWGLGRVPMAQAIALTFISPLIALFLAAVFLGETIGPRILGGSVLAFAGVLVIVVGQASGDLGSGGLLGSIAILASALCYAVNIVMMRRQATAARPLEITFFQNLTVASLLVGSIPFVGGMTWPAGHWLELLGAALLSSGGLMLFAYAYARGEAGYLSVTEYSGFLWAALLGWLVFREPVSPFTIAGAVLIVGGCVMAARQGPPVEPEIEALA
jgi:S-adenosylmethionine uptake transporter